MKWKTKLLPLFTFDRIVRRLIASWFLMALVVLCILPGDFADTNYLAGTTLDLPICLFLAFFLLIAVVAAFLPTKRTDSFVLLLSLVSVSTVWLIRMQKAIPANERWLFCFVLIGIFALVLWDFLSQNEDVLARLQLPAHLAPWLTAVLGVLCFLVIAITTCLRYKTFSSPTYDFGIFAQMYHGMAETFEPLTTCERDKLLSHFAVHLSPIYYILLPFYLIFRSPLTLQVGQAVAVASGIIPVYLLMKKWEFTPRSRVVFSLIYMLLPAISKGCFFDLHENCFLFPLLLWLFWAYESEKLPLVALFTVMTCLVKEDSAVYVTIFALYVLISGKTKKRKLTGLAMAVYAVAYFLFAVWYINTFGEGIMSGRFDNVSSDGTLFGVIVTAFVNPGFFFQQITAQGWESVQYILALTLPLGFLPFATGKPTRWLLLCPMLLNLLTDYPYQLGLLYQYHFGITAFLLYAALMNWRELRGKASKYFVSLALAASFVLYTFLIMPELGNQIRLWSIDHKGYTEMEETLALVPEDASVNASTFLVPHLAERMALYDIGYHPETDTDFVILDIRGGYHGEAAKMAGVLAKTDYVRLVETLQIAVYVSPNWQGDQNALLSEISQVATIVSSVKDAEDAAVSIEQILSVLPSEVTICASDTLHVYLADHILADVMVEPMFDYDMAVLDLRAEGSAEREYLLAECQADGFLPVLHNEIIAVYANPAWSGEIATLQNTLRQMGYS